VSASAAAPLPSSYIAAIISGLPSAVNVITAASPVNVAAPIPKVISAVPVAAAFTAAVAPNALATKGDSMLTTSARAFGGKEGEPAQPAALDRGFDGRSIPSVSDRAGAFAGEVSPGAAQLRPAPAAITPGDVRALMVLGRAKGTREYTRGYNWERTTFTLAGENDSQLVIQEHVLSRQGRGEETSSRSLYVAFKDSAAGKTRTIKVDEDANGAIVLPKGSEGVILAGQVRAWTERLSSTPAVTPDGIRKLMVAVNRIGERERASGRNWESATYTVEAKDGRKIVVRENHLGGRGGIPESSTRVLTMIFPGKDGASRSLSATEDADGRIVLEREQNAADFEAEFGYWTRVLTP